MKKDYYQILNVSKSATKEEIKKSYKKLAIENHPDKHKDEKDKYEKKFKEIAEAYSVLSDDQKRANYDKYGTADAPGGFGGGNYSNFSEDFSFDINDIFGSFFGDDFSSRGKTKRKTDFSEKGSDLRYAMKIKLEDTLKSFSKKISFNCLQACEDCNSFGTSSGKNDFKVCESCRGSGTVNLQQGFFFVQQTCNTCKGNGSIVVDPCKSCKGQGRVNKSVELEVNIPVGVDDGMLLKQKNAGEAGIRGGASGDLFIKISIEDHHIFKKEGKNLILELPITFTQAILGAEIDIIGLDKKIIKVKIPKGSDHGKRIILNGEGLSYYDSSRKGDMVVILKIEIPKKLTNEQEEILRKLNDSFSLENHPNSASFFDKVKSIFS